jgi:hypothetical protein
LGLLVYKRAYKLLPLFSSYIAWSLVNDLGSFLIIRRFPNTELKIFLASTIIDSIFMFCVLIEVSMSVLKPIRALLPRWAILAVALFIGLAGSLIWYLVKFPGFDKLQGDFQVIGHLQFTVSAMRLLFFLILAAFGHLLSIGFRDRELQIATGFGFYSLASICVGILHWNLGAGNPGLDWQYHLLDQLVSACYSGSLIYWVFCFAQEVPERREFTPQMQGFLLAMAGNARTVRMAMSDSSDPDLSRRSRR